MVVIWGMGLIALLFVTYIAAARYRSIEAFSLAERARAESMAGIGVNVAILDLLTSFSAGADQSTRFIANGTPVLCRLGGDATLAIAVFDEGGKVDLNAAEPELLDALLRGVASEGRSSAQQIVKGILGAREKAVASADSQNPTPPPAFKSVFELDQLPGMSRDLLRALVPLVTVHSHSPGVSPRVASADVLKAVTPPRRPGREVPSYFVADPPGRAFLIASEALMPSGARFAREAVVEFSTDPVSHRIREWRDGAMRVLEGSLAGARLASC